MAMSPRGQAVSAGGRGSTITPAPVRGRGSDVEHSSEVAQGHAQAGGDGLAADLTHIAAHAREAEQIGGHQLDEQLLRGPETGRSDAGMQPHLPWSIR